MKRRVVRTRRWEVFRSRQQPPLEKELRGNTDEGTKLPDTRREIWHLDQSPGPRGATAVTQHEGEGLECDQVFRNKSLFFFTKFKGSLWAAVSSLTATFFNLIWRRAASYSASDWLTPNRSDSPDVTSRLQRVEERDTGQRRGTETRRRRSLGPINTCSALKTEPFTDGSRWLTSN